MVMVVPGGGKLSVIIMGKWCPRNVLRWSTYALVIMAIAVLLATQASSRVLLLVVIGDVPSEDVVDLAM